MKKITLLCLAEDRDRTLEALRGLGVLHLSHVHKPEGGDLAKMRGELHGAESALYAIRRTQSGKNGDSTPPSKTAESAQCIVKNIHEAIARKADISERIDSIRNEIAAIEPFGDFDPGIVRELAGKGLIVKLYQALAKTIVVPPEGTILQPLGRTAGHQYFAVVGSEPFVLPETELPLPARSLASASEELAAAQRELTAIEDELKELSTAHTAVEEHVATLKEQIQFLEAAQGMGKSERIVYLQGFCPADQVQDLRGSAALHGWGLTADDPAALDPAPTLIRNPGWLRPIEPLFAMIKILPGYREVDVSASFLLFLSIFFAMIVGDAGYGMLFLIATFAARMRWKRAAAEPFRLLSLFSVCTIVWGIVTGCYFGVTRLPAPLAALRIDWLGNNQNIMNLCMILGCIHLSVAHLWNLARTINSPRAIAQLGWVAITWTMFFAARAMFVGTAFPTWYIPIAVGGLLAVIVFMTPLAQLKEAWINHAMLPLSIMSTFGDVLSYLRLFALGVASVEVAAAFNAMAMSIGFGNVASGLIAALVLFLGHALNVGLSALSVLVHGIRLNALEFSMHLGLEWSGIEYKPFTIKKETCS